MTSGGQEEPFSRLALAWLCEESSPHRRVNHIPVQSLSGKFQMKFLPTVSLTKAFPLFDNPFFSYRIVRRNLALGAFKSQVGSALNA